MNFSDILQIFTSNLALYGGAFVVVLSILVFVHEFGHYIIARACGVKVEVFSIGFGKQLFGFYDRSGTHWKVCLVPLGGYVKLFGDVDPASVKHEDKVEDEKSGIARPLTADERKRAFFAQPVAKRAAVVVAGPAINYLFALILLSVIFIFNGQPVTPPSAAAIIQGSSADKSGFKPSDTIISIDGRSINNFDDIRREMMIALDEQRHFVIERNGEMKDIYARPAKLETKDRFGLHSIGMLGLISPRHAIEIKSITKIDGAPYTDLEKIRAALIHRMGREFRIEVTSGTEKDTLIVKPQLDFNKNISNPSDPDYDALFVSSSENNTFVHYTPVKAVQEAFRQTWVVTQGTLQAIWQIIVGTRSPTELGGVIRIGALAGDMAKQGVIAFMLFTALLSINLGLVNLFPIPMLDGGHLVFYALEAILGRPVPDRFQEYAFRFGLVFLVGIMVYANLNDLMQLIL